MDRNGKKGSGKSTTLTSLSARRAWIEILCLILPLRGLGSLSARRAWIEILTLTVRNVPIESLSARRAWIEMELIPLTDPAPKVALRKESVDRNV